MFRKARLGIKIIIFEIFICGIVSDVGMVRAQEIFGERILHETRSRPRLQNIKWFGLDLIRNRLIILSVEAEINEDCGLVLSTWNVDGQYLSSYSFGRLMLPDMSSFDGDLHFDPVLNLIAIVLRDENITSHGRLWRLDLNSHILKALQHEPTGRMAYDPLVRLLFIPESDTVWAIHLPSGQDWFYRRFYSSFIYQIAIGQLGFVGIFTGDNLFLLRPPDYQPLRYVLPPFYWNPDWLEWSLSSTSISLMDDRRGRIFLQRSIHYFRDYFGSLWVYEGNTKKPRQIEPLMDFPHLEAYDARNSNFFVAEEAMCLQCSFNYSRIYDINTMKMLSDAPEFPDYYLGRDKDETLLFAYPNEIQRRSSRNLSIIQSIQINVADGNYYAVRRLLDIKRRFVHYLIPATESANAYFVHVDLSTFSIIGVRIEIKILDSSWILCVSMVIIIQRRRTTR